MFWSIIAANRRKTVCLIILMGVFLVLTGAVIGAGFSGHPHACYAGAAVALAIWFVMLATSLFASDSLLLGIFHAREVSKDLYPQLFNVVEEMVIAGSLPAMPRIFILDDQSPNAIAMGKSPKKSCICVTAGLLAICTRDELQGVVAHEIGHILNRDVLYMTVAATMLGSILMLSETFLRTLRYSPLRFTSRSRRAAGATAAVLIASLVMAALGPVIARILYFSISRKREYLADATSARLTRYPEGLASALDKIGNSSGAANPAPSVTVPFYIVNPDRQALSGGAFATHPPLAERISILRAMTHGAGSIDYAKAYIKVTRRRKAIIPASDLGGSGDVKIREEGGDALSQPASWAESARRSGDIIRVMNNFSFITCPCGLRMKLPPELAGKQVVCPRCKRVHHVGRPDEKTRAGLLGVSAAMSMQTPGLGSVQEYPGRVRPGDQEVRITQGRWQRIACAVCGHSYEISPRFSGRKLICSGCGSTIHFNPAAGPDGRPQGAAA